MLTVELDRQFGLRYTVRAAHRPPGASVLPLLHKPVTQKRPAGGLNERLGF